MRGTARKLIELVAVLLVVSFGTFMLLALIPGDPAVAILGAEAPPEAYATVNHELGLDLPLYERYWSWITSALSGDLGNSIIPPGGRVTDRILAALPVSVELAVLGLLFALVLAVPLAMWSAYRPNGRADRLISAGTFGLLSVPSFLAGLLLILVTVNGLGWFPRAEWVRLTESLGGNLYHAALPALVVGLLPMVMFARVLRGDLIATLQEDYILAARAKGMPTVRILTRDALRPSSFSLVTLVGVTLGSMVGSTVIVESLFALPGMGTLIVRAANQGDMPLVQGAVLVIAVLYVLVNALVDFSYGHIDPRVRRARV